MNPISRYTSVLIIGASSAFVLPASADTTTLNLLQPVPLSANFPPLITALALNYFEAEGIEVNLLPASTTIPYVAFLQNGQADLAILDPPQTFQAVSAKADIKVVYSIMPRAAEGIAVAANSPYTDVAELKGTTVGLVSDRDRATFGIALDARGLSIDDVTAVVVGEAGPTLANAFRKQTVTAIAGSDLDWLSLQANGIEIRTITPDEISKTPSNSVAVSASRIDELAEPLTGFFRAWSKGVYAMTVDPEVTAAMAREAVPEEWESEEFGRQLLDASVKLTEPEGNLIGDVEPDIWRDIQPAIVKQGVMKEPIDPAVFVDNRFIAPANDWSKETVDDDVAAWREQHM